MWGRYKAVFILPVGTEKKLSGSGWDFNNSRFLTENVADLLIPALGLVYEGEYAGVIAYTNKQNIEMRVVNDDKGLTEFISLQVYEGLDDIHSKLLTLLHPIKLKFLCQANYQLDTDVATGESSGLRSLPQDIRTFTNGIAGAGNSRCLWAE